MRFPEKLDRAISIRQPLVEQILRGDKLVEYRSRITHIRGRVYLYAAKQLKLDVEGAASCGDPADLPRGMIVGSVEIVGCTATADGGFSWQLALPRRYRHPVKPAGTPQPGFWRPR